MIQTGLFLSDWPMTRVAHRKANLTVILADAIYKHKTLSVNHGDSVLT